ncbi:MAG: 2-hydroxyglutaryl-CoA dehydratase [Clostridia bacterium]|nr:2-hydroxyglutaryl-CoA dehydratase [Clostridia bacterium]
MEAGIDLGSRNVKIVIMNQGEIAHTLQIDTIEFYRKYGKKEDHQLLVDFARLNLPSFEKIVSTGYGRLTINLKGSKVIPELKAHMLGAIYQTGIRDFTLLDLGGQDTKVIKVKNGKMVDFQTNDRCAASSGRYLENMAGVLDINIDELSRYSANPVELSSTCAVFGESELIGKIIEGHPMEHLAAGINYTIFKRFQPMLAKLTELGGEVVVFTGGVAYNKALQEILVRETGLRVVVPPLPEFNGAIGCAIEAASME